MDNGGRFRSGHYPKLAITCSTQQEVVCLRFILATRRVLLGLGNGAACVVHALAGCEFTELLPTLFSQWHIGSIRHHTDIVLGSLVG